MKQREMHGEADRRERIEAALARYEASGKAKRGKRKSFKLFSLDRDELRETGKEKNHEEPTGQGKIY